MQVKVGIVGMGAIGSVIAKSLYQDTDVNLFYHTRTPKSEIKIKYDSKSISFPIKCNLQGTANVDLDWVIVCLKAHQIESARNLLKNLIKKGTKVAIIRNGINLTKDMIPFTRKEMILPCLIDCSVQPDDDGWYNQLSNPTITTLDNKITSEFEKLFSKAEMKIVRSNNFLNAIWMKLIESASIGGLQCLTRQTCHIFHQDKTLSLYRKLIREGIEVAKSKGADIDAGFEEKLVTKVLSYPKTKGSSMLTDMLLGNRIEIEAKNDAIATTGKTTDTPTPLNDLICVYVENINANQC